MQDAISGSPKTRAEKQKMERAKGKEKKSCSNWGFHRHLSQTV